MTGGRGVDACGRWCRVAAIAVALLAALARRAGAVPPCEWLVYDAARGAPHHLLTDGDATPPFAMRLDAGFNVTASGTLAQRGGLDFDGDGKTDPFRARTRPDGSFQWQSLASGNPTAWQDMAYAGDSVFGLNFGDFDGDGKSDVFASHFVGAGTYQWVFSSGGTSSYANLASTTAYDIAFGRFDGDVVTDVFATVGTAPYDWDYSSGGAASLTNLSHNQFLQTANLRFGDFDGDGKTDPFYAFQLPSGEFQWIYWPGGTATMPVDLAVAPFGLDDVQLGDFDGDGKTDVFATQALPDGRLQWMYWAGGAGDPIVLDTVDGPVPLLGDFVGDARTDAVQIRCGAAPLVTPLPAVDVAKTPRSIFRHFVGEANGDGRRDILRNTTCENVDPNSLICSSGANLVQTLLSDGHGGFTVTPLQNLFSPMDFTDLSLYVGDVTGDGLTDLVWIAFGSGSEDLFLATADGDGSFSEHPKQTLTVPDGVNPYVVDVNHDGRADLLWTTVCMYGTGFDFTGCAVGDANQVLTGLAAPDGTFTLHALQSLGASGWTDFVALVGDVNGDGNPDLVFNSTCQKTNYIDFTCTVGAANLVYVALGDGNGGFTLGPLQTYETSGWDNFQVDMADVDGDGRRDLVWIERCQTQTCSGSGGSLVVRVGLARPDGTFAVTAPQDLGFGYWTNFRLSPGDVDGDGKADLIFYNVGGFRPLDSAAVYEFLSDGSGGFTPLPMQLLAGRGWHDAASGGYTLHVGDVTGDGKDDLVWLDTSPADHDRVIVSGDAAAITGTTTTTLPDCHALSGAAGVSCLCTAGLRLEECAAVTLPGRLTGGFEKACELLGKIPGASKRSQRRLRGHALARIAGLRRFVARRGIAKKLTQPCDAAVADRLSALRTDAHP